jgi:hypothetical protein
MTAEDNGVPEDDDPFAYLYRGQEGEAPRSAPQPGVPRTSYQQATQVGRTQYGQRPQQPPYGQPQVPQQQAYQQQQQQQFQQTAPIAPVGPPQGGGRAGSRPGAGGGGRGGSNRAVMLGAAGVVLAVVIGISVALLHTGTPKSSASAEGGSSAGASTTASAPASPSASPSASAALPGATNVSGMQLGGNAVVMNNHTGGASTDGKFVPLTAAGMSITWLNVTVPTAGQYTFWVHYANAAGSTSADPFTMTVNGKQTSQTINLQNWISGNTDWDKAWQRSYASVTLNAGSNTIALSYGGGSSAGVNVDQLGLTVSSGTPPWP